MTKIIIVDYSLEIVIVIIILNRFMPLFEAACHILYNIYIFKKAENTLPELLFCQFLLLQIAF